MAIQENPYLPPQSRVADAVIEPGDYIDGGRAVPAGHATRWLSMAWRLFRRQPGMWVLLTIVLSLITIVLGVIPIVSLAVTLVMPVFMGGLMLACRKIEQDEDIDLADLFSGFKHAGGSLVLVGLMSLGLMFAIMIPAIAAMFMGGFVTGADGGTFGLGPGMVIAMLVFMALVIPVYMALWFAPALVVLQGHTPTRAMTQSFRGCLRNLVPFLLYSVILFVLMIVATIPLLLGWLVLIPVLVASIYAAYRDIFLER